MTIPNTTNGYPVTSIGSYAFFEYYGLTGVTIPDSVTSIGDSAFFYCTNLTSVIIPGSVTSIGIDAFYSCSSLTNVTIGSSVISIGEDAFAYCTSLTSVKIPDSITSIGDGAFADCSGLTSVTIGSGVTSIWDHAFYVCSSLTRVYFQGNSPTPTNDTSVFSYDPATVYYLPGTTGWASTFDGRPTKLWFLPNPVILGNNAGLGVQANGFGFTISWATNISVVVEAATNLANPVWMPVSTNILTGGTSSFSDPQWTHYPGRYYRLRSP